MSGMCRITAVVRPYRLEAVKTAVAKLGVGGLSVTDVRGRGQGTETVSPFAGDPVVPFHLFCQLEVVVSEELVEDVVQAIVRSAQTGQPGDGKVFLEDIEGALRIRTGEVGQTAL